MSNEILANPAPAAEKHVVQRLRPNAVGLGGVLFMTIATAAPITAMLGNVPIAVGSGNGQFAPAGFMVATLILALFAIGYAQMARFITATGAFYGFISHGLGRIVGMASGVTVTMTYIVFEAALVGIFAFFCEDLINTVDRMRKPVETLTPKVEKAIEKIEKSEEASRAKAANKVAKKSATKDVSSSADRGTFFLGTAAGGVGMVLIVTLSRIVRGKGKS